MFILLSLLYQATLRRIQGAARFSTETVNSERALQCLSSQQKLENAVSMQMEKRLRKRSLRPSETGVPIDEPPQKKSKKQVTRVEGHDKLKKSKSKNSTKHSSLTKKGESCIDSSSLSETSRNGRCLLVSLNVHAHDLHVHRIEKQTSSTIRGKLKGRVTQRSESVEVGSDFGSSSNGGGSGKNFKNPDFMVSIVHVSSTVLSGIHHFFSSEKFVW